MSTAVKTIRLLEGPSAWLHADYAGREDWILHFSPAELAELERAAESVRAKGLRLDDAEKSDFDLPLFASRLATARAELAQGRGFVMLRGIPVSRYSEDELQTLYWGIGTHLGIGVTQSLKGDRLGHVMDIGGNADRYYTRGGELEFHMDPVDVVGLLCVRGAKSGGESRIVSSMSIYNTIARERPDLLPSLTRGYHYSRRQHDPSGLQPYTAHRVPVFTDGGMGKECYFLPAAFRRAAIDGAPFDEHDREAVAFVAEVAARPDHYLDMRFREGDIQFLNNRTILHARTDYVEHDDPSKKRLLYRLWLMMPDWPARPHAMRPHGDTDRAGGGFAMSTSGAH